MTELEAEKALENKDIFISWDHWSINGKQLEELNDSELTVIGWRLRVVHNAIIGEKKRRNKGET